MSEEKVVIMPEDSEAARPASVVEDGKEVAKVWLSRQGFIHSGVDAEMWARREGATHRRCKCGKVMPKDYSCGDCREKADKEHFLSRPTAPWDGKAWLYSDFLDKYFMSPEYALESADDLGISIEDMRLYICKPQCVTPVDPYSLYEDIMPDDGDEDCLPKAVVDAFDALNAVIEQNKGVTVSWILGNTRLDLTPYMKGEKNEDL